MSAPDREITPLCFAVIQHLPTTAAPTNETWGNGTEVVNATEVAAPGYTDPDGE